MIIFFKNWTWNFFLHLKVEIQFSQNQKWYNPRTRLYTWFCVYFFLTKICRVQVAMPQHGKQQVNGADPCTSSNHRWKLFFFCVNQHADERRLLYPCWTSIFQECATVLEPVIQLSAAVSAKVNIEKNFMEQELRFGLDLGWTANFPAIFDLVFSFFFQVSFDKNEKFNPSFGNLAQRWSWHLKTTNLKHFEFFIG